MRAAEHNQSLFQDLGAAMIRCKPRLKGVRGWVPEFMGKELMTYAMAVAPSPVVELGSFVGRSTIMLATAVEGIGLVYAVDSFCGDDGSKEGGAGSVYEPAEGTSLLQEFVRNIERAGLDETVIPYVGTTKHIAAGWSGEIGLLFIDAGHKYEDVISDLRLWTPHVKVGGFVIMDDITEGGVLQAFQEWHTEQAAVFPVELFHRRFVVLRRVA